MIILCIIFWQSAINAHTRIERVAAVPLDFGQEQTDRLRLELQSFDMAHPVDVDALLQENQLSILFPHDWVERRTWSNHIPEVNFILRCAGSVPVMRDL